jgi:hypothetical protein
MDHGTVAHDRKIEAVAVEGDEWAQLSDLADEGGYQLLFGPVADVGRSEGLDRPVIILAPSDEGADANDRMIDVLRKLVSDSFADLFVRLAGQPVRGRVRASNTS